MTFAASGERHCARLATLAFVRSGDDVLLRQHSVSSDRFAGRWNGIGGHVEPGENIGAAALRELREETGLDGVSLQLRGVIHETGLGGHDYVVFLFVGHASTRTVRGEAGAALAWQSLDDLAGLPLVGDVAALLPRLLEANEPFFATERYDGGDGRVSFEIDPSAAESFPQGGARG